MDPDSDYASRPADLHPESEIGYTLAVQKRKPIQPPRRAYPSLLAWRQARGLSQREAADVLGLTQTSYSRAELGQVCPRKESLRRVIAETGVPLEVLVGIA
jgi:DNA-binding XRE family transcriptional regulator